MKIQAQSQQFPNTHMAAGPTDPPSAHFDGGTEYYDIGDTELELQWVAPDTVEVVENGWVIGEIPVDEDWDDDYTITGWDYIKTKVELVWDKYKHWA